MNISKPRRGFAIITVLVVMAALSVILSVVTVQIVSQRKLHHHRTRQLHADWLEKRPGGRFACCFESHRQPILVPL